MSAPQTVAEIRAVLGDLAEGLTDEALLEMNEAAAVMGRLMVSVYRTRVTRGLPVVFDADGRLPRHDGPATPTAPLLKEA
jgi:hypothetical protein